MFISMLYALEMISPAYYQFIFFAEATAVGFLMGGALDFYRALRRVFKLFIKITFMTDLLFWLLVTTFTLLTLLVYWQGEVQFYTYLGLAVGFSLYILILSERIQAFWLKLFTALNLYLGGIVKSVAAAFLRFLRRGKKFLR